MAKQTVLVSDLSGDVIQANKAAEVRITYADARRGTVVLDVSDDEIEDIARRGRKQARRGRKPKES